MSEQASRFQRETPGRQPDEVATTRVLVVMATLAGFIALTVGGLWVFYAAAVRQPTLPSPTKFEAPRLQTDNGTAELTRLRAAENAKLGSYGWIDRDRQLIRIPIERAMHAVVARGAHGYEPLPAPATPAGQSQQGSAQ